MTPNELLNARWEATQTGNLAQQKMIDAIEYRDAKISRLVSYIIATERIRALDEKPCDVVTQDIMEYLLARREWERTRNAMLVHGDIDGMRE